MEAVRTLIFGVLLIVAWPVGASEFGDRYPAGAIKDRARAEEALRDASAEEARITRESKAREAECYKGVFVNKCREDVRRDRLAAERELRRVRVEAHDLQRRLDAQDAARKREETAAAPGKAPEPAAAREPGTPGKPEPPKQKAPAASKQLTPEEAARNRAAYEQRVAEKQKELAREQARAPERAQNAADYKEKQIEAEQRAQQKAADAKKAEERRAERRKQLEAQEAQREEVRRKAEEAAKNAPK
jgi:hypothetical protein